MIEWVVCLVTVALILVLVIIMLYLLKRQEASNKKYHSLIVVNGGMAVVPGSGQSGSLLYDEIEVDKNTLFLNVNVNVDKLTAAEMVNYILTLEDKETGQYYQKQVEDYLVVGREENDSHSLVIGYEGISRSHCKFTFQNHTLYVEDLNSTNHTYLNGVYVSRPLPVRDGDVLCLGSFAFKVYLDAQ